jgi:hypothetical protein
MFSKDALKGVTLATGLLIYFYLCGAVYLIGFWSTFNVDVSSFVSISDIPKNFIYPFVFTNTVVATYMIMQSIVIRYVAKNILKESPLEVKPEQPVDKDKWWSIFFNVDLYIAMYFVAVFKLYTFCQYNPMFWAWLLILFTFFILVKISRFKDIQNVFIDYLKVSYFRFFLILFPVVCFGTGKIKSLDIYNNDEVRPIKAINNSKIQPIADSISSIKLLGFLGEKAIVSSFDNKIILVLNMSSFEAIQLDEEIIKKRRRVRLHPDRPPIP